MDSSIKKGVTRGGSEVSNRNGRLKEDLLHVAIVDIFINLKVLMAKYSGSSKDKKRGGGSEDQISDEEQKRLLRLGNLVLIDYVRSMVDLLRSCLE